jgi:hypothetical protein
MNAMKKIILGVFVTTLFYACGNPGAENKNDSASGDSVHSQIPPGAKNYTDAKGLQQGDWIITGSMQTDNTYNANAKVEEGKYLDGQKEGLWTEYYPDGKIKSKGEYSKGKKIGKWAIYDENGVETGEAIYN